MPVSSQSLTGVTHEGCTDSQLSAQDVVLPAEGQQTLCVLP